MAPMTYTVEVTRDGDAWVADVRNLPGAHTFARNLPTLFSSVDEVIRLVTNLPDNTSIDVSYTFATDDELVQTAADLGIRREQAQVMHDQLADEAQANIAQLTDHGYSVRDISGLLHMSPGRVSQIAKTLENA